jgi:hypothetical protein
MELKITKEKAKKLYPEAPDWFKKVLEETFGKDAFTKKDFNDFETFEDLCQAIGMTEEEFNNRWNPRDFDPSTIAFERLKVCTRAYNPDWQFDTFNTDQKKWYPYFTVSSSGFGFSNSYYLFDLAHSAVGSRLCFESEEKSNHAGRQFTQLFQDFITGK